MTIGALIAPDATSSLMAAPGPGPLAVAEPADACRQSLDRHLLRGKAQPALEALVVGEELGEGRVDACDVRWVARQRRHPERPAALAEERADERGDEAGDLERVLDAGIPGVGADVVAVVEGDGTRTLEGEHGADVIGHGCCRSADVLVGVRCSQRPRVISRYIVCDISVERIVGRGLVGHDVRPPASPNQLRLDVCRIADEGHASEPRQPRAIGPPARRPRPGHG